MSDPSETSRSGPPHNPGLRELVAEKLRTSSPAKAEHVKRGYRGWHERGYLPHRDEPGLTQFATFHLADSFPKALRSEWAHLWKIEEDRERRKQLEGYLDKGAGESHLRKPELARLVENELRSNHGVRYELRAWVIMPNHVHILFRPTTDGMSGIIGGWKKHSARLASRLLGLRGAFWAEDYWDTFIRDTEHELQTRRYIENNPVAARLVRKVGDWLWSSGRRD